MKKWVFCKILDILRIYGGIGVRAGFAVYTLDINLTVLGCDNKKEHRDKKPNLPLEMIIG